MMGSWTRLREGDLCSKKLRTIWKAIPASSLIAEFRNVRYEISRLPNPKNDMRLISLRFKTNSYRILVGLLVRFDSYSYSYSYTYRSRDDRGRGRGGKVRDLWREGGRRFTDLGRH